LSTESSENSVWNETLANGERVNGSCFNGYQGSVSRVCTQSGSSGIWGEITGSCDGIVFLFFSFLNFTSSIHRYQRMFNK